MRSDGIKGNGPSNNCRFSANGKFLVFQSNANNLTDAHSGNFNDVFLKDLETGEVILASVKATGEQGNGNSGGPSVNSNGRYVAFSSDANNLVIGDINGYSDIFVKDMQTGTIRLASSTATGGLANGGSHSVDISDDGNYVVFVSQANNLVNADTNNREDVFVKNLTTGEVKVASCSAAGVLHNGYAEVPAISGNGRYVSFDADAGNLVAGDTNGLYDAFVKDMQTGTIVIASQTESGVLGNGGGSGIASLSSDGRRVLFMSYSDNLYPGDTNGAPDLFLKNLDTGKLQLVSAAANGAIGNLGSGLTGALNSHLLSSDARFAAFNSDATNLVPNVPSGYNRVYVKDLKTGAIILASSIEGRTVSFPAQVQAVSPDGRLVAFFRNDGAIAGDSNGYEDVFIHGTGLYSSGRRTRLALTSTTSNIGRYAVFTATLTDSATLAPIVGAKVKLSFDWEDLGEPLETDSSGKVGVAFFLGEDANLGAHALWGAYAGDDTYAPVWLTKTIQVTPGPVKITVTRRTGNAGATVELTAKITNWSLFPLAGRTLAFKVNGNPVGSVVSNYLGVASTSYTIPPGTPSGNYPIAVTFAGDTKHKPGTGTGTLTVG